MPTAPRDYADLMLAPVALHVDQRLEDFAALDREALHQRVTLETNQASRTATDRSKAVVESVTYLLDLHGWITAWDPRGIRLSHGPHTLVLGVPEVIRAYVAELPKD